MRQRFSLIVENEVINVDMVVLSKASVIMTLKDVMARDNRRGCYLPVSDGLLRMMGSFLRRVASHLGRQSTQYCRPLAVTGEIATHQTNSGPPNEFGCWENEGKGKGKHEG